MDILDALKNPFDPKEIHWRIGAVSQDKKSAIALAYLNARDVMKRLDSVVGINGWQDKYFEMRSGRIICELSLALPDPTSGEMKWITKSDGAGDTNIEAEKGGVSDSFKRAAVKFGIGRYLYYLGTSWHPIDQYKKFKTTPALPDWALPKKEKESGSSN